MKKLTTIFIAAFCFAGIYAQAQVNRLACTITVKTDSVINVACNGGNNGSINAVPVGGTSPYTYLWTPTGSTNQHATGLTAGCYTVTVTDHNGCTGSATVCLTQPPALTATTTSTSEPCNGMLAATATVTAGGGTPGYTYTWAPSGQTKATATGLSAGTYTVTVTDKDGCTITASTTITQPTMLVVTTMVKTKPSCDTCCNGKMYVVASGGTAAYSYSWNNGMTTDTISNLCPGRYTCCVTDAHGCMSCDSSIISGLQDLNANDISYSLYPDPNNGHFTISLSVKDVQPYTIEVYNILGQSLSSETIQPASGISTRDMDISAYGKGVYFIAVKSPTGGMSMKKIIVL